MMGSFGADAKSQLAAPPEPLIKLDGSGHRERITENQRLGLRIDAIFKVVRQHAFAPLERVAAVVARAIKQLAKVQVKIAQKSAHAVNV